MREGWKAKALSEEYRPHGVLERRAADYSGGPWRRLHGQRLEVGDDMIGEDNGRVVRDQDPRPS